MSGIDFKQKISFQRPFSKPIEAEEEYDIVRQFESDRGRIVNSAAIRRLQQKTQVFPLERNAAVRSRLTHSMEVQQVGRHIAKEILNRFKQAGRIDELGLTRLLDPFESIVEMACLMHDIGNPPFGHFGESAINDWFAQRLDPASCGSEPGSHDRCQVATLRLHEGESDLNRLRSRIRQDLSHFEGNAQAIRMVYSLLKLNLTYAQVGCILKYTRPAYWASDIPASHSYLMKKPGYYLAEEAFVDRLRRELHMGEFDRFPLTYIMEAADDISYCVADLEDAVEKSIFTVEQLYQHLIQEWGEVVPGDLFDKTVASAFRKIDRGGARRSAEDQFFMYLRVFTVARLVPHAAQRFIDNLDAVYQGSFNQALLEDSSPAYRLPQAGQGLAGIEQASLGAFQQSHIAADLGRHAGEHLHEVQRGALAGQQHPRRAAQPAKRLVRYQTVAVCHQPLHLHLVAQLNKDFVQPAAATEHAGFAGNDGGFGLLVRR